jgi:hypothetical protein
MQFLYHFVKIDGVWYLKAENKHDIIDHFNIIMKREFKEGFYDRMDNITICKGVDGDKMFVGHPTAPWSKAIECYMQIWQCSWIEAAAKLEEETLQNRLKMFENGKLIYLSDGLTYTTFYNTVPEIEDECYKVEMEFPKKDIYTIDDVRYIQWNHNGHWYAKIDKIDVVWAGKQKWDTKEEAIEASKKYINNNL